MFIHLIRLCRINCTKIRSKCIRYIRQRMQIAYSALGKTGIFFLICGILYNACITSFGSPLYRIWKSRNFHSLVHDDEVTIFDKQCADLRKLLPAHGAIGYVTNSNGADLNDYNQYFMTCYALAPVIVLKDLNHDFILGNFFAKDVDPKPIINNIIGNDYAVVRNIGNNIILFGRKK